jgi:uncharacterized membrane protein YozB (DUF420 family)
VKRGQQRVLKTGVLRVSRQRLIMILLWVSLITIVFFLIRGFTAGFSWGKFWVYFSAILLVALVLGLERFIERALPDGDRRHRLLGTFTMVLYVTALFTSSLTYFMLYVLYPPKVG